MKTMFLMAAVALALGGAAQAQAVDAAAAATPQAPAAVTATHRAAALRRTPQNGAPRYEMRRNGLMQNGLLPADGEQG